MVITVEAGGYTYQKDGAYWYRVSQDGSKTGEASKREIALLAEIISLYDIIADLRTGKR